MELSLKSKIFLIIKRLLIIQINYERKMSDLCTIVERKK